MKTRMNYDPLIIRYLNGDLSAPQREDFEARLKTDTELNEEYRLHTSVDEALQMDDDNRFRDMLDGIHEELVRKRQFPRWVWYTAALVLVCLAIALSLILTRERLSGTDKLFATYYKAYDSPGDVRSVGDTKNSPLAFGLELYGENDYEGALTQLEQVIRVEPDNNEAQFYAGVSSLQLDRFQQAIPFFKVVIDHQDILFLDQARWYLALTYVKTGDMAQARQLLSDLELSSRFYGNKAGMILKKISNE